jgi:hypothetical protein
MSATKITPLVIIDGFHSISLLPQSLRYEPNSHKTVHLADTIQNAQTHKICTFNCQLPQNISQLLFIRTEAASQSVYQRLYRSVSVSVYPVSMQA